MRNCSRTSTPYLVANQGGRYTKHIYIGSQRIVSKLGDFDSYGSDPRRIQYAGSETDGLTVDYKTKYAQQQQIIKDNYATFEVKYDGEDNNDYVDNQSFCCNDGSLEGALANAPPASTTKSVTRAAASSFTVDNNFHDSDSYECYQFFYHPDHLGSSSYITNLDGEVVQHIEYVPFGEVFLEERNSTWNTPYLFNAKEFDEETGLYYYGARYYDPRLSLWISTDPLQEKYAPISTYCYSYNNPVNLIDIDGRDILYFNDNNKLCKVVLDKSNRITLIHPKLGKMSLSSVDFGTHLWAWIYDDNKTERQVVANVMGYYANAIGVTNVGAYGGKNGESMAFYDYGSGMIMLAAHDNGQIHPVLDNKYNLMNTIIHENLHRKNRENNIDETHLTHARVVLEASKHFSYKNASANYKKGQIGYFSQLIMNAYYDGYRKEALDMITEFNNANLGATLHFEISQKRMIINDQYELRFTKAKDSVNL